MMLKVYTRRKDHGRNLEKQIRKRLRNVGDKEGEIIRRGKRSEPKGDKKEGKDEEKCKQERRREKEKKKV